jgi:orotidine-5'-phosphate decarboxylase
MVRGERSAVGRRDLGVTSPIAVALDTDDLEAASSLGALLAGHVRMLKVGLELYTVAGPRAVTTIAEHAPVFLDLKLHDIPTTVQRAARQVARLGAAMLTVHASGGAEMIRAARAGVDEGAADAGVDPPSIIAVTVLTNLDDAELATVGQAPAGEQVVRLGELALRAGADGLVCAPADLRRLRAEIGPEPVLVTPGVRPTGSGDDEHARAATPAETIADGSDLLVIGRPITQADDPVAAVKAIALTVLPPRG